MKYFLHAPDCMWLKENTTSANGGAVVDSAFGCTCGADKWLPTAENINAVPEPIRKYIHDIETKCDPSGDVQTIAILTEQRDALLRQVEELNATNGESGA